MLQEANNQHNTPNTITESQDFSKIESAIPSFVTSKVDFKVNHGCGRLNRISCDNSYNFVSQCSRSLYSNCNMSEMVVDCRKTTSEQFYKNRIGRRNLEMSTFGSASKCVQIKTRRRKKTAICSDIKCDISKKFYYINLPQEFGNFFSLYYALFTNTKTN